MNRLLLVAVCIANSVVGNAAQVGAVDDNGLLPVHVRRGVPEISADTSLDTSIARRHAIAAASSMSDPRRHVCLCAACASAADACPMCRRPVEDVFRVFLS